MRRLASLSAAVLTVLASSAAGAEPARAALPSDQIYVPVQGGQLANDSTGLTASPSSLNLYPQFSQSIHDYVLRCHQGVNNIALQLTAASGTIQAAGQSGSTVSVPVGLAENQAAVVQVPDSTNEYWIRCLPHDFPALNVTRPGNPSPGWYLTGNLNSSLNGQSYVYAMILDNNGTPVWYQAAPGSAIGTQLLPNNTLAWSPNLGPGIGVNPNGAFNLYQLDTQVTQTFPAPIQPTDPHELLQMANGHRMIISTPIRNMTLPPGPLDPAGGRVVDCVVQESDGSPTPVWTWRASDHIQTGELTAPTTSLFALPTVNGQVVADLYHCNSVDVDPATGNVLVSVRHTSGVYLINRAVPPTGPDVIWKMGGNTTKPDGGAAQRLAVTSDPQGSFFLQHDARFQGTNVVSLFDNHTDCSLNPSCSWQPGNARGVEYTINLAASTAMMDWQYAPAGGVAQATGSFRRYSGGTDNVVAWGFRSGSGFDEVDGSGTVQLTMRFPNGEVEYRVLKVPQSQLDVKLLRATAGLPRYANWQQLGGTVISKPGSASWAPSRLDLFGQSPSTPTTPPALMHQWWDGTQWSGWGENLGGTLTSGPAAVSWGTNRIDVFVRGPDSGLWHIWWDGTQWSGWEPHGGNLVAGPAVAAWSANRLDVLVIGADNQVWHRWWDGVQWNGWQPLGGQTTADPGAASWGPGRLDIFIRNSDGTLNHRWWDQTAWSDWEWHAGSLTSAPNATSSRGGQVDVVAAGANNVVQRMEYLGGWQNWQSLGGSTTRAPSIVGRDVGVEDAFMTGGDGTVYHQSVSAPNPPNQTREPSRPAPPRREDASRL